MSTYTPISSQTISGGETSITFNNIPQTYTDLVIVFNVGASSAANCQVQFNNDTSASYSTLTLYGTGSSVASGSYANNTVMYPGVASALPSTITGTGILQFNNYSNTGTCKTMLSKYSNASAEVDLTVSTWFKTDAVTSIKLFSYSAGWLAGSTFNLYGIVAGSPKAYGGNTVTTDGTYWYHTFTSSGVFTPQQALTADYLVVAGGGGGGNSRGYNEGVGGAGGGGFRTATAQSLLSTTSYPVIIGAGGSGLNTYGAGTNGNDSSFNSMTSTGGGYGASDGGGGDGGSGGGAGCGTTARAIGLGNTPSTSPSQGNNGGASNASSNDALRHGGGGGGAGAVGANATSSSGGAGGAGAVSTISGSSVTYAGGGGGAGQTGQGAGGAGGGGAAAKNANATNGTANTGGGGGSQATNSPAYYAGSGGSGIVIVRYAV